MSSLVEHQEREEGRDSEVPPASASASAAAAAAASAASAAGEGPMAGGGNASSAGGGESAPASAVAACDADVSVVEGAAPEGAAGKTIFGKKSDKNRVLSDADRQMSPLQIAFSRGHDEIVRLLISRGALG